MTRYAKRSNHQTHSALGKLRRVCALIIVSFLTIVFPQTSTAQSVPPPATHYIVGPYRYTSLEDALAEHRRQSSGPCFIAARP